VAYWTANHGIDGISRTNTESNLLWTKCIQCIRDSRVLCLPDVFDQEQDTRGPDQQQSGGDCTWGSYSAIRRVNGWFQRYSGRCKRPADRNLNRPGRRRYNRIRDRAFACEWNPGPQCEHAIGVVRKCCCWKHGDGNGSLDLFWYSASGNFVDFRRRFAVRSNGNCDPLYVEPGTIGEDDGNFQS
jgi:hypothetical protein